VISWRKIENARLKLRRDGLSRTAYGLALRAVNTVMVLKILKGMDVSRVEPEFLRCPEGLHAAFLSPATLRRFASDPKYDMSASFIDAALAKGDECFGLLHGDDLAAYGWYSFTPTQIDPPELRLCFDRDYVYMYKGFTHPDYRGQRLHAFGISLALDSYLARGFKGLVSYVESTNFSSLRSYARIGYATFGSIYVAKVFGHHLRVSTRGCRRHDFRVELAETSLRKRDTIAAPIERRSRQWEASAQNRLSD